MSVRLSKNAAVLLLIASLVSGCTTFHPVSYETKSVPQNLHPGDDVRVTTRDGRVLEFTMKEFTERSISGEKEQVALSDIVQIERRELNKGKSALLIGGIAATAVLIYAITFFASIARNGL
jgi:hypothetical protein